jgi:hypothetical protein
VLPQFCVRRRQAGYDEIYRKRTIEQALRIYDRLVVNKKEGIRPVHRP